MGTVMTAGSACHNSQENRCGESKCSGLKPYLTLGETGAGGVAASYLAKSMPTFEV